MILFLACKYFHIFLCFLLYLCQFLLYTGSVISTGREPRSCVARVFNFKLGSLTRKHHKFAACKWPLPKKKTRPRFCPFIRAQFCKMQLCKCEVLPPNFATKRQHVLILFLKFYLANNYKPGHNLRKKNFKAGRHHQICYSFCNFYVDFYHRYRRRKIDCSSLFIVPATSAAQNSLLFFFFCCSCLQN